MSRSSLTVRCLASTRATEQLLQEQEFISEEKADKKKFSKWVEAGPAEDHDKITVAADEHPSTNGNGEREGDHVQARSPSQISPPPDIESDSALNSDVSVARIPCTDTAQNTNQHHTSCVQEAQLSIDGTCVFTSDYDRTFSVYPIDPALLHQTGTRELKPYARFLSSDPIWAFAANPLFDVNDPVSTHVLVSRRDRYITLHNALWDVSNFDAYQGSAYVETPVDISTPIVSYKLINSLTEAVTAPLSLAYSHTGTHFFAGARNNVYIFDVEYADGPTHTISAIPSTRSKLKGGGRGFKGMISALALFPGTSLSSGGILAAGARTRHVGIYDANSGSNVTTFSLPGTIDGKKIHNSNMQHIIGDGVTSLKYSPCGKYLYVAERNSDVLLLYDVRNFSIALSYCAGRQALTKQKLGFDVWNAGASPYDIETVSHEVWAGGTDGMVRVWRNPYIKEGAVEADEVFVVGEGNASVVDTMVHRSGSLAVAACGRIDVDNDKSLGRGRGGGTRPKYKEWGSVDVLGLS